LFASFFLVVVTPTANPGQKDDKALEDWMIAVIAGVAGALVIVVLILLICRSFRKKTDEGKEISTNHPYQFLNSWRIGHYLL